jgi:hypothetical protein
VLGGFPFGSGYFGDAPQSGAIFPNLGPLKITAEALAEGTIFGEAFAEGGVLMEADVLAAVIDETDVPT